MELGNKNTHLTEKIRCFKKVLEKKGRKIKIYERSIVERNGAIFFLTREGYEKKLVLLYLNHEGNISKEFTSEEEGKIDESWNYKICPCNRENADKLREHFPFTKPRVIGLTPAIGCGDRIGLTTPGHIRAVRKFGVFPVLAQQSIREMTRTARTPRDVLDDASWAVFQEGYREGFAADADHLKTEEDVKSTFEAGFTMYTLDPSSFVDDTADKDDLETLKEKFDRLPWLDLKCSKEEFLDMYLGKEFLIGEGFKVSFTEESLIRAAVKYSAAIAHVSRLKRLLDGLFKDEKYDLEVSVDETESPTRPLEHLFIALELKRLGINIQGLALRFVGRFEKAVDYIGDLKEFEETFKRHVLIAKKFGPYKLSVHSGSDKFSIYPILGRFAGDMIHLKTAGTSYLESLRIIARHDPNLFREIVNYSIKCFKKDRASYHISTELSMVPPVEKISDRDLERVYLDEDPGRQVLHVTFGSILTAKRDGAWIFRDRIRKVLLDNEDEFYETISKHIERHIKMTFSKRA